MLTISLTKSDFRDLFKREGRGEQFSYEGLNALYDYLNENELGQDVDVISLCHDFTEINLSDLERETNFKTFEELSENRPSIYVNEETIILIE